jgi:hypothetical protein
MLYTDQTLAEPNKAAEARAVGIALEKKMPKGGYVELEDNLIFSDNYCIEVPHLEIKSTNEEITNNIRFYYYGDSNEKPQLEIGGADGDEPVIITGIANPENGLDAVNKNYADENFLSLKPIEQTLDLTGGYMVVKEPQSLTIRSSRINDEGFYIEMLGSDEHPHIRFMSTYGDAPVDISGVEEFIINNNLRIAPNSNVYVDISVENDEDLGDECLALNSYTGSPRISGIGDPKAPQDAATKNYVDSMTLVINANYPNANNYKAPYLTDSFNYDQIISYLDEGKKVILKAYIDEREGYDYYYLNQRAFDY